MNTKNCDAFQTTRWSLVLQSLSGSESALDELISLYWYPVYGYVRRRAKSDQEAEDLTQGFFARLLERDYLASADRERGKLRAFLLTDLKFFLSNERDKANALKRRGEFPDLPLDFLEKSDHLPAEPLGPEELEQWFDRSWAHEVFDRALTEVEQYYRENGSRELFDLIKPCLAEVKPGIYSQIAEEMGRTPNYVKQQVFRLRDRFRIAFRQIVADTVDSKDEIDAEISHLLGALMK